MSTAANIHQNSSLAALAKQAAPLVLNAIKKASAKTGVDFAYMLEKAGAESGFDTAAKSVTSSATGLYQFVDKTWLTMVKKYGADVGLGKYANAIDDKGNVANAAVKNKILSLRKDPAASAMMAAEYTSENKTHLQEELGPNAKIGSTELYLAHFLGAGGATQFLKAYQANPVQQASDLFPQAANANHNVFYDSKTGSPRTLAGIYDMFAQKFGAAGSGLPQSSGLVATATQPSAQVLTLAQSLANDMNTNANATSSLLYAQGAGTTMLANHELVHWFTARQIPTDSASAAVAAPAAVSVALTPQFTADPAAILMQAQTRQAAANNAQRQAAARSYANISG